VGERGGGGSFLPFCSGKHIISTFSDGEKFSGLGKKSRPIFLRVEGKGRGGRSFLLLLENCFRRKGGKDVGVSWR